jgi:hypothetical protein
VLEVSFPWVVVTNRGDTVKAETFSTLRPTFKDKYAAVVIFGRQTDQMSSEDDTTWLQERSRMFAEHGFQKADERFFLDGQVLCAESQLGAVQGDYCRSLDGFTIAYVGDREHLQSALKILNSLSNTSK